MAETLAVVALLSCTYVSALHSGTHHAVSLLSVVRGCGQLLDSWPEVLVSLLCGAKEGQRRFVPGCLPSDALSVHGTSAAKVSLVRTVVAKALRRGADLWHACVSLSPHISGLPVPTSIVANVTTLVAGSSR